MDKWPEPAEVARGLWAAAVPGGMLPPLSDAATSLNSQDFSGGVGRQKNIFISF